MQQSLNAPAPEILTAYKYTQKGLPQSLSFFNIVSARVAES